MTYTVSRVEWNFKSVCHCAWCSSQKRYFGKPLLHSCQLVFCAVVACSSVVHLPASICLVLMAKDMGTMSVFHFWNSSSPVHSFDLHVAFSLNPSLPCSCFSKSYSEFLTLRFACFIFFTFCPRAELVHMSYSDSRSSSVSCKCLNS